MENKRRFWTLGENRGRWVKRDQIVNDKRHGSRKAQREQVANELLGDMAGDPLLSWLLKEFPETAKIRFMVPTMHGRSHITIDFSFPGVSWLNKVNKLECGKLIGDLENAKNLIRTGKLSTSATGLFRLGKR